MASKKISELDLMNSSSLSPSDLLVIVDVDEGDNSKSTKKITNAEYSGYLLNTVMTPKANKTGDNIIVNKLTYASEVISSATTYTIDLSGLNIKASTPSANTTVNFSNASSGRSVFFKLEPLGSIYTLTIQSGVTLMNYFSTTIPTNKAVVISAVCTGPNLSDINVTVSIQQ